MENTMTENNVVTIEGKIVSGFSYSHEIFGEKFFLMMVEVKRLSQSMDVIPVMVSDRMMDVSGNYEGMTVLVSGQFRSYNRHEEGKNRLVLSVFAREIEFLEDESTDAESNSIFLDGYICKEPVYRKTPLGREIADVLLAVNRPYGKSDYIPCICWGRNARYMASKTVGARLMMWGRIQSREFMKKLDGDDYEKRVAYEVSAGKIKDGDFEDAGQE